MADSIFGQTVKTNPALGIAIPTGAKAAQKREAPEDDIVDAIKARAGEAYWGEFALFLIYTGLRRGEALGLQWGDIDFKTKQIACTKNLSYHGVHKVGDPKTEAGIRTLPLLPPAETMLRPMQGEPDDYVFHGKDPKNFSLARPISSTGTTTAGIWAFSRTRRPRRWASMGTST